MPNNVLVLVNSNMASIATKWHHSTKPKQLSENFLQVSISNTRFYCVQEEWDIKSLLHPESIYFKSIYKKYTIYDNQSKSHNIKNKLTTNIKYWFIQQKIQMIILSFIIIVTIGIYMY